MSSKILNRALIVTGGELSIPLLLGYVKKISFDQMIAVDGGLAYFDKIKIVPDYLVGDFDTVSSKMLEKYKKLSEETQKPSIKEYNSKKDATDSQIALELAIQNGAKEIILLGGTGSRLDHMLSNIFMLKKALNFGIRAIMVNEKNKIYLIQNQHTIKKSQQYGRYISFIPYGTEAIGVTLRGFLYPLEDKTVECEESLGISNQIVEETAEVIVKRGILIAIESMD